MPADIPDWTDMVKPCIKKLEAQVKMEMRASINYLSMGAHFARDAINRPGFSKFFFDSANEEREHAIKIIDYLLMRGQLTNNITNLKEFPVTLIHGPINSGLDALREALKLETMVTESIHSIAKECEKPSKSSYSFNDYHLVDYLTGEFLDEQYKAQRDLAGKVSTLGKMVATNGRMGELLFDKKLLYGEI
ncbi:Ferritin subunit [Habropoda laboriosa]|uniref:Ferritin n=2 Tax=Habropoda laboriosa TaxID=597456 RepID=A0A0L7QR45_9HYME|nr:Ferritin subunit [Habropoda laboriosa]